MVDDVVPGPVERCGQHFLSERNAHGVRDALPQRSGGRFDADIRLALRMSGGLVTELTKVSDLIDVERIAAQVEQAVEQHRSVPVGQHKTIAIGPLRVRRIVLQIIVPEDLGNIGHAHRHARVPGVGSLNGIHTECANGVGELAPARRAVTGGATGVF